MITMNDLKEYTRQLSNKITFNTENLYIHRITLDWGYFNKQVKFDIINENAFPMTSAQVREYLHNYAKPASSSEWNNKRGLIPCSGFYTNSSGTTMRALYIGEYYNNTNVSVMCENVSLPKSGESNPIASFTPDGNIYVSDYVITLALNNVLRPSLKEYKTYLSLGGSQEGSANINWTCLKTPMPNGKFLYKWTGFYSQTKSIAITSSYGNCYMSPKIALGVPDSRIISKAIISMGQEASTCWLAMSPGGPTLDFYILRATSSTINNTLNINIQAEYIDN